MKDTTREKWLERASDIILKEHIALHTKIRKNLKLKLSVGYPPNSRTESKTIGVCFPMHMSAGKYNEIFIIPEINDSMKVLEVLVHEIIHAVDDCASKHGGMFKEVATAVGLVGKMTATVAGPDLREKLARIHKKLGDIPHSAIDSSKMKRQKNRNLKVWCECGFKFNTSKLQIESVIDRVGMIPCCMCESGMHFDF